MTTLYEFKLLSTEQQFTFLWESGVYLDARITDNYTINLYGIDGFYIEVFYNSANNKIEFLESFKSVDRLSPYLKSIDLQGFLQF